MSDYQNLLLDIKSEFPKFELIYKKDSTLMKIINVLLLILTFGKNKTFMKDFVTTLNCKVYLNSEWDKYSERVKCILLRHERVHMRQSKKYGLFLYSFLYLFVYLPFGLCYYRTKFEKEAYEESMRAVYQYYGPVTLSSKGYKSHILKYFTSSAYGYMWLRSSDIEKWFDETVTEILKTPRDDSNS